jgi:hypothetical protein
MSDGRGRRRKLGLPIAKTAHESTQTLQDNPQSSELLHHCHQPRFASFDWFEQEPDRFLASLRASIEQLAEGLKNPTESVGRVGGSFGEVGRLGRSEEKTKDVDERREEELSMRREGGEEGKERTEGGDGRVLRSEGGSINFVSSVISSALRTSKRRQAHRKACLLRQSFQNSTQPTSQALPPLPIQSLQNSRPRKCP